MALADLGLDRAFVVYPGSNRYPLHERVEALPLSALPGFTPWSQIPSS